MPREEIWEVPSLPQLVGTITDFVSQNGLFSSFAGSLTSEQIGFKVGMLVAAVFPLLGTLVAAFMRKAEKKKNIRYNADNK